METASFVVKIRSFMLWFAFILVTLSHWKQLTSFHLLSLLVVICFHFSNFEPLETAMLISICQISWLWFAFILVTLSHWKQHHRRVQQGGKVVICFHFSNFEPLETAYFRHDQHMHQLWFAFILVTLSHWKQLLSVINTTLIGCDLLSF